jgi:hypothetical protein
MFFKKIWGWVGFMAFNATFTNRKPEYQKKTTALSQVKKIGKELKDRL